MYERLLCPNINSEWCQHGDSPQQMHLLPRAPDQQGNTPFVRCSCRTVAAANWYDCDIYQILGWPTAHKAFTTSSSNAALISIGSESMKRKWVARLFQLPYGHMQRCWRRATASVLRTIGAVCHRSYFIEGDHLALVRGKCSGSA